MNRVLGRASQFLVWESMHSWGEFGRCCGRLMVECLLPDCQGRGWGHQSCCGLFSRRILRWQENIIKPLQHKDWMTQESYTLTKRSTRETHRKKKCIRSQELSEELHSTIKINHRARSEGPAASLFTRVLMRWLTPRVQASIALQQRSSPKAYIHTVLMLNYNFFAEIRFGLFGFLCGRSHC